MDNLKQPPHNIEAEQAIIGGILMRPVIFDNVSGMLSEADFYRKEHRILWSVYQALEAKAVPIDPVTVVDQLVGSGQDRDVPFSYIETLVDAGASTANIAHYARLVKDRSLMRKLLEASYAIGDMVYNDADRDIKELLHEAQSITMAIDPDHRTKTELVSCKEAADDMLAIMDRRANSQGMIGISTGINDLDEQTSGMVPKDLIVIGGRPSMGKSTLAVNIATAAAKQGHLVLIFSLEMPVEDIMMRIHADVAGVSYAVVRSGRLNDDEWARMTKAVTEVKQWNLHIDETPGITPSMIRARSRKVSRRTGMKIGMIVVDYLQLMRADSNTERREGEISEISRKLKNMAKEFECPVLALSQLNRALENRSSDQRRPRMSDLRESGAIEQDADVVIFVYRDEVYNGPASNQAGVVELIGAKQRNGPLFTVYCEDALHQSRIGNLQKHTPQNYGRAVSAPSSISTGLDYE